MLNHSVSQLRQISVQNISVPGHKQHRRASSSASAYKTTAVAHEAIELRPPTLRRRSTRAGNIIEAPLARLHRLESAIGCHTFETFFVISHHGAVLYISEVASGSSPVFEPFLIDYRSRRISITVYSRYDQNWHQISCFDCDLCNLRLHGRTDTSVKNAILLLFEHQKWYIPIDPKRVEPVDYVTPRSESYSFNQLMRLQTSTEYINDATLSINTLKEEIDGMFINFKDRMRAESDVSLARLRLEDITFQIKAKRKHIVTGRTQNTSIIAQNQQRRLLRSAAMRHCRSTQEELRSSKSILQERVPSLALMLSETRRVQREITTALSSVYPIDTSTLLSKIRGLHTPLHSDYHSVNAMEAAALGYMAHLTFLLSHYLNIPLRFPIRCASSYSYIVDPISVLPETSDITGSGPPYSMKRDRKYPLHYVKGSLDRFKYGVFLLNKNIEQLLQGRGLVCGDLRDSLKNLRGLVFWITTINEDEDVALQSQNTRLTGTMTRAISRSGGDSSEHARQPSQTAVTESNLDGLLEDLEIRDNDDLLIVEATAKLTQKGMPKTSHRAEYMHHHEKNASR